MWSKHGAENRAPSPTNKTKILFDGTLGKWTGDPYIIHLKDGAKLYHGFAYKVPNVYELTLKNKVERICKIGLLKKLTIHNGQHQPSLFLNQIKQLDLLVTLDN